MDGQELFAKGYLYQAHVKASLIRALTNKPGRNRSDQTRAKTSLPAARGTSGLTARDWRTRS